MFRATRFGTFAGLLSAHFALTGCIYPGGSGTDDTDPEVGGEAPVGGEAADGAGPSDGGSPSVGEGGSHQPPHEGGCGVGPQGGAPPEGGKGPQGGSPPQGGSAPEGGAAPQGGSAPEGGAAPQGGSAPEGGAAPQGGSPPQGGSAPQGGSSPEGGSAPQGGSPPQGGAAPEGGAPPVGGSGEGGEGGGGVVIIPPPANDACAGAEYHIVDAGDSFSFPGTFAGALDDYQTFCADDSPGVSFVDVVYELDVQQPCTLSVTVSGVGIAPAISQRSSCETDEYCSFVPGDESESVLGPVEPGSHYFVISSLGGGDVFDVSVTCEPPVCGDGLLASTEECDDGGSADGDGCDSSCKLEVADPLTDTCSGASAAPGISIAAGEIKHVPSSAAEIRSTINASDSGTGSCMLFPDPLADLFPSNDHVYRITPSASGTLTVKLGYDNAGVPFCGADQSVEPSYPYPAGCYDRSIHVREADCEDVGAEIACAESAVSWWAPEELSFAVSAGSDYYVFVDGWVSFGVGIDSADVGEYVLDIDLQ